MKDGRRPHLRLVVGRGDGGRAPLVHRPSEAGPWHPSRGGRPPLVVVSAEVAPGEVAPGERARLLWWRRSACHPAAPTTSPVDATPGVLIEMAAWR